MRAQICGGPVFAQAATVANTMLRVECYAGHRGEETPRAIVIGERRVEVCEILDRWLAPDHRYFKLKGDDGDVYIVRHDVKAYMWELTMFERGGRQG